jgi:hypothetical protein
VGWVRDRVSCGDQLDARIAGEKRITPETAGKSQ